MVGVRDSSNTRVTTTLRCQIDRSPAGGAYYWRLSSLNGRVVAVSAEGFRDYARCAAAFDETCRAAPHLTGAIQHPPNGGGWAWHARDADGRSVARSARSYERYSTCQKASERFRTLLREFVAAGRPGWPGTA